MAVSVVNDLVTVVSLNVPLASVPNSHLEKLDSVRHKPKLKANKIYI